MAYKISSALFKNSLITTNMTNKDSIQAAHLEAIKKQSDLITDKSEVVDDFKYNDLATSCTTITAEAIKDYEDWKTLLDYDSDKDKYWILGGNEWYAASELPELFLNQKAKI